MASKATNAGVHGATGIEFQKHCALYLLFERFTELKDKKYFICLEHHEDFLFCFQTEASLIQAIEAYQAKKASKAWGMGIDLSSLLQKLIQSGEDLIADTHPKTPDYAHTLTFITNNSIQLHCGSRPKAKQVTLTINESNTPINYVDIDTNIQSNLIKGLTAAKFNSTTQLVELKKLSMGYIDLPKTNKVQVDSLVGQFKRIFGTEVSDPIAAVDTLLKLFRNAETVLNNGNVSKLMDVSKRVESDTINAAIEIITTKAKAYEFWRNQSDELKIKLGISVLDHNRFNLQFENSFDYFKDLKQGEHQKIFSYVEKSKASWAQQVSDIECINFIYEDVILNITSNLSGVDLKAAVSAAYLEIKG